jgi:hypothetical protein
MKKLFFLSITFATITILMVGCDKNGLTFSDYQTVGSDKAQLKVNFFSMYRALPPYQIKLNNARVSNSLLNNANPTPFPGGGLNTGGGNYPDYLAVNSGNNSIAISIPKAGTNTDSIVLGSATGNLTAGKKYSLYFADTGVNMTTVLVEDSLPAPDSGFTKFRFVNLIPDMAAVDLYLGTVKVASNIPYKGVSPSFVIPTNNASTTWALRTVGGAVNLTPTYASASTLGNQRVFTIIARGYNSVTSTTDPRQRKISFVYNQ